MFFYPLFVLHSFSSHIPNSAVNSQTHLQSTPPWTPTPTRLPQTAKKTTLKRPIPYQKRRNPGLTPETEQVLGKLFSSLSFTPLPFLYFHFSPLPSPFLHFFFPYIFSLSPFALCFCRKIFIGGLAKETTNGMFLSFDFWVLLFLMRSFYP